MPNNCPVFKWHLNSGQNCPVFGCPVTPIIQANGHYLDNTIHTSFDDRTNVYDTISPLPFEYLTIWNPNFKKFGIQMFLVFRSCRERHFARESYVVQNPKPFWNRQPTPKYLYSCISCHDKPVTSCTFSKQAKPAKLLFIPLTESLPRLAFFADKRFSSRFKLTWHWRQSPTVLLKVIYWMQDILVPGI